MRHPPLRQPPIAFAHRGARANAPENTIEAFTLALRLGATGIESDVWLTADGVPVLDHGGMVRRTVTRRPIGRIARGALPDEIPALVDLYDACGTAYDLSLDVKDPAAAEPILKVAAEAGALDRLWLCHPDVGQVGAWRRVSPEVRLVNSTRLRAIKEGLERRAAELSSLGVDALNLHASEWTGGRVTLLHRFDRLAFGWDAQLERVLVALLVMGVDGVYSDHVGRMVDALAVVSQA